MTHERSQLGSGFERFEEAFRQAAEKDRLAANSVRQVCCYSVESSKGVQKEQ
jgi:hypothetical protein